MVGKSLDEGLVGAIHKALEQEVEKIVLEEAQEAAKRAEKRVREKTAQVCSTVLDHFSIERFGNTLRITVDFPHGTNPNR